MSESVVSFLMTLRREIKAVVRREALNVFVLWSYGVFDGSLFLVVCTEEFDDIPHRREFAQLFRASSRPSRATVLCLWLPQFVPFFQDSMATQPSLNGFICKMSRCGITRRCTEIVYHSQFSNQSQSSQSRDLGRYCG